MSPTPEPEAARALAIARQHFAADVGEVEPLGSGEFSRAFAFTSGGQDYVIRLNETGHAAESFAKDDFAARHFASPRLPIPRIVAIGQTETTHFAVSERAAGRVMTALPPDERRTLLPSLLDALDAIGRADVNASHGYGDWDATGTGRFATWRDYLAIINEDHAEGYYQHWHAYFLDGSLERDVYETIYRHLLRLLPHCPEERALIHNDYWFMNIIGEGERITGVVDWANALYGDPLYEIARLSWGAAFPGWWYEDGAAFLRDRYGATPGYDTRLACYSCHVGLDDLRFYAKTGRRSEYTWARDHLLALVNSEAGVT